MIIQTGRFGQITVGDEEQIWIPLGIMGFKEYTKYCLVDPGDDTLILWLQSVENPNVAFPILEPKIFRPDYTARLSAVELKELKLENVNQSAVFTILTISEDPAQMTANLKAPVVINLKHQLARQIVLQENEYSIKYLMFKELRAHLATIRAQKRRSYDAAAQVSGEMEREPTALPIAIRNIPPSLTVRSLQQG